ncbi:hypothetical protein SMA5143A_0951 [Streptomyces sp. MA5143a]|nr:hypothetical protein SMA5143A_0951 [Streptomyces sp. MA5143a]
MAEKEVDDARNALAATEARPAQRQTERDAYVRDGSFPALFNSDTGGPDWALCQWAQSHIAQVAFKDHAPTGDAYARLVAQDKVFHRWLRKHGRIIPAAFGDDESVSPSWRKTRPAEALSGERRVGERRGWSTCQMRSIDEKRVSRPKVVIAAPPAPRKSAG